MRDLLLGIALLLIWGVLQFVVQPDNGWIHVGLIVGVMMVIRGIALYGEES